MPGLRQQRRISGGVHLRDPRVHRFVAGLDAIQALFAHVRNAIGDPLDMLLDGNRHVAKD